MSQAYATAGLSAYVSAVRSEKAMNVTNGTWSSYVQNGNEVPPDGVVELSLSSPVDDSMFADLANVCRRI